MNKEEILHIIKQGESERIEFKTSFGKEVIESIVAFSNAKGGKVIVGVNDNKNIGGITVSDESIQIWLNQIKQNTNPQVIPDVQIFELNNRNTVVFDVMEYPIKPVAYRNKYFKRIANSNHLMSLDEITNEHLKTINSSWDFYPDPNHGIEHISSEKIKHFISKIEQRTQSKIELSPFDFLTRLEIIRNNQLSFGGYLLFAKDYCMISDVQVGRFKSEITIIDSITLNADLLTETDEIIAFIKKHLMVEYIITGEPQRTERFDYPLDAIREIVINMIVHRDYRDSSASIIKIFDNRIEFYNPGNLYGGITIEDLLSGNYSSKTRNKLIARAFKEIGLIERYGSGIMRVRRICKEFGINEPKFEEIFDGFKVTLFKQKLNVTNVGKDVGKDVGKELTGSIAEVFKLIHLKPEITIPEIAVITKYTQRTVERDISHLKELNLIKRLGGRKEGKWEIAQ